MTIKHPSYSRNGGLYCHCGKEADKIPPMKLFKSHNISTISELRKIILFIDSAARSKGFPVKHSMSHEEANTCYYHGESALVAVIPDSRHYDKRQALCNCNHEVGVFSKVFAQNEKSGRLRKPPPRLDPAKPKGYH
eukprot:scaffold91272_cov93-Cyclotella_meneghiniana.AAC.1